MGEAVDKKPLPSRSEVEAAALAGLGDNFFKFLEDSFPDINGEDDKQGEKEGGEVKEEEEEEELEWICNSDLFPPLDTSLTFGPTDTSDALKVLEDVVVDEMDINGLEKVETGKARVPKKRRSPMKRRPRLVFTNHPSQRVVQNKKEKQTSVRSCTHCGATETPQWRQGPDGPSTLCNACGVRYNSGRLFDEYRPANSPTFCPEKHSNIHRKVVEMRGAKQTDGGVNANMKCRPQSRFGGNEHGGEPDDCGGLST